MSVQVGAEEEKWLLVWEDAFSGSHLDESKWNYGEGNGHVEGIPGWGNGEKQYHQKANVEVVNGRLIITGRKERVEDAYGIYDYTSALIDTKGKFSQKYGRFEAKMKLPAGQGYWPAFWLMPLEDVYGGWAASGEIDVMEAAGANLHKISGALHFGGEWPENVYKTREYWFPADVDITDFNLYSVEWEPEEIRWYVNDEIYQRITSWYSTDPITDEQYHYPAPFDQEFYLIFDLSIGGHYGGDPDQTTEFPGQMVVDYVKVYKSID